MKQFVRNQCRRRCSRSRRPSTVKSREEAEVMRVEVRELRNGKKQLIAIHSTFLNFPLQRF